MNPKCPKCQKKMQYVDEGKDWVPKPFETDIKTRKYVCAEHDVTAIKTKIDEGWITDYIGARCPRCGQPISEPWIRTVRPPGADVKRCHFKGE